MALPWRWSSAVAASRPSAEGSRVEPASRPAGSGVAAAQQAGYAGAAVPSADSGAAALLVGGSGIGGNLRAEPGC